MSEVLYNCETVIIFSERQVQICNPQTLFSVLSNILEAKFGLLFFSEFIGTWRWFSLTIAAASFIYLLIVPLLVIF